MYKQFYPYRYLTDGPFHKNKEKYIEKGQIKPLDAPRIPLFF